MLTTAPKKKAAPTKAGVAKKPVTAKPAKKPNFIPNIWKGKLLCILTSSSHTSGPKIGRAANEVSARYQRADFGATDFNVLSANYQRILTNPANTLVISPASTWEMAIKTRLGKLDLPGSH